LNDYILWKNAAAAEMIEVCRLIVVEFGHRYRMEYAAPWETRLYNMANAAISADEASDGA
jgi:hypothetical protein